MTVDVTVDATVDVTANVTENVTANELPQATRVRGKVIDMAIPKKKTQQSTSTPKEGLEQTSVPHPTSAKPDDGNGASADAGRAPSTDASNPEFSTKPNGGAHGPSPADGRVDGKAQDAVPAQSEHTEHTEQANGVVNGHYTQASSDQAFAEQGTEDEEAGGKRATVKIKGRPTGVAVELGEGDWDELIELLAERLAAADGFFRGGKVVLEAGPHRLEEEQLRAVRNLLEVHDMKLGVVRSTSERTLQAAIEVGLATSTSAGEAAPDDPSPGTTTIPTEAPKTDGARKTNPLTSPRAKPTPSGPPARQTPSKPEPGPMPPPPPKPTGHFVHRGSLRSGQILRKAESIVVIGDVNPGAQVISSGDVIVWGRLRGIAYAGVDGNRRSVVAALDFVPTQLRIANLTAIAPEQKRGRGLFFWRKEPARRPEIARVIDERIVVEPWDEAKIGKFSNW